ncbi:MAG: sulfur carrier protein ThiS [Bacteriovoracaceae bacterium]
MYVTVNGKKEELDSELALDQFLIKQNIQATYVAVAVNCEFVPKSQYSKKHLQQGDDIEIVTPHPGG